MITDKVTFGEAFSDTAVEHTDRMTLINAILEATRDLYTAITDEIEAENLALNNKPTAVTSGSGDAWDDFRGNGPTTTNEVGLNSSVQAKGEALFDALDALGS